MITRKTFIERAVEVAGSQSALARLLNVAPQQVQQWCKAGRAPAKHFGAIEQATNGMVTRVDLLRDVEAA